MGLDLLEELGHAGAVHGAGHDHRWPATSLAATDVAEVEHQLEIAPSVAGAGMVGLVDDEDVPDLQQARLVGLDRISHARRHHDHRGVRGRGDVDLHLSDPDGLDHDGGEPDGIEHPDRTGDGERQTAAVAPSGHGPHERDRVDVDHPNPVAEDGPAGERRGRIDGKDRGRVTPLDQPGHDAVDQGRLARTGCPGDADDRRTAALASDQRGDRVGVAVAPLDQGEEPADGSAAAAERALQELGGVRSRMLTRGGATTPRTAVTTSSAEAPGPITAATPASRSASRS